MGVPPWSWPRSLTTSPPVLLQQVHTGILGVDEGLELAVLPDRGPGPVELGQQDTPRFFDLLRS